MSTTRRQAVLVGKPPGSPIGWAQRCTFSGRAKRYALAAGHTGATRGVAAADRTGIDHLGINQLSVVHPACWVRPLPTGQVEYSPRRYSSGDRPDTSACSIRAMKIQ